MTTMTSLDLDAFVRETDLLGGPGSGPCDAYWQGLTYAPGVEVDETLDPFSDAYVAQQMAVYQEISGRAFDQEVNEHSVIDITPHIAATNPYNHPSPGGLALHLQRLSRALSFASPPRGGTLLDMGCGWGLSSELAAYCGLSVTAVDINPDFVRLVEARAERLGLDISAQKGEFDTFFTTKRFDAILFYECLHHALRPWTVLDRMARMLSFDGKIVMAGEPINEIWWKHWGLRLDPLSLYCIRKFGWFESGWSAVFLQSAIERAGLACQLSDAPEVGFTVVGSFSNQHVMTAADVSRQGAPSGWDEGQEFLTSTGDSMLTVTPPEHARRARLDLTNFRPVPLGVTIKAYGDTIFDGEIESGRTVVDIDVRAGVSMDIRVTGELWCPDVEIHNGDGRKIGIHLRAIGFV